MEWWSNGVMKRPVQFIVGFRFCQHSNTPILQYSKTARTCIGKTIELRPGLKNQVFRVEYSLKPRPLSVVIGAFCSVLVCAAILTLSFLVLTFNLFYNFRNEE